MSDADSIGGENVVTLLTLHAAKGLEFPVVFITGLEDGLIPHSRSLESGSSEDLAEERRLFYVGITRAESHLYLTYAFKRTTYGTSNANSPSRFLADIPTGLMQGVSPRVSGQAGQDRYRQDTTWGSSRSSGGNGGGAAKGKITPFPTQQVAKKQFPIGQRVFHAKFGAGLVIESKGNGNNEEVTVAFEDKQAGIKRFLASFGNLTTIKG